MRPQSPLLSVIGFIPLVNALPSLQSQAAVVSLPIKDACSNLELRGAGPAEWWLVGSCLTSPNSDGRIESATELSSKLESQGGVLGWKVQGEFWRNCKDCRIEGESTFSCKCVDWSRKNPDTGDFYWNTSIDLDEHIAVYNGHLLSNLTKPASPPRRPSKYPVPKKDFHWRLGGVTTCPTEPNPYPEQPPEDLCDWFYAGTCTTDYNKLNITEGLSFTGNQPTDCFKPILFAQHMFKTVKVVGEAAWEVTVFEKDDCSGEPLGIITPEEEGVCKSYEKWAGGFRARPLFNGDPNPN